MNKTVPLPHLSILLLGPFAATLDERPLIAFETRKIQALLIYLACRADQPHQRESLMTLLWPDMPMQSAQANMRQSLYRLRKLIPAVKAKNREMTIPFVLANRQTIQINPEADYYLDVAAFTTTPPAQAIPLYRGDFLADFYLPDSEAFEAWAASRRADYQRRALNMMEKLTSIHIQQANFDEAVHLAQRQLEIDNYRESSHRQLMEAWTWNGRRQDALAHYETLYQLLQDELAIEPEAETHALIEAIRAGELKRTTPSPLAHILPENFLTPPQHNIPSQSTLFIGRESELAQIAHQLADPACRLLTILGAGGMGKTRLGIEAAQKQVENFSDGVVYVSLASIGNEDAATASSARLSTGATLSPLVSALIDALKIPFLGTEPLEKQLINYLRRKEVLLVFDNFEHLLATASFLSDLLSQAPQIKILTTSRERLNLQEEWLLVLQGLPYANEDGPVSSDGLSAVQLFSQRARQVKADFDWTGEKAAVLRICQLVGGMPLGLELASAWVLQLSCQEIADEIEAGLDFLTSETRNIPDRHRSIRAVFGHSWQLLTAQEKDVLQKLSIFRGGFDRPAAQAVAGASLPTLARLVSKSLLSVGENGRYAIHELLRQFAAEKLAQTRDDVMETGRLHCRYFLALLAEQEPKIYGPDFPEMITIIEREMDNIRTALQWAIQHQPNLFTQEVGWVLRFFYDSNTLYQEGEIIFSLITAQLKKALILQTDVASGTTLPETLLWAQYNLHWAAMIMFLGHTVEAERSMEKSLLILPTADPAAYWTRAICLVMIGAATYYNGNLAQAIAYLKESVALSQAIGNMWGVAVALWLCGFPELLRGNANEAQRVLEESERLLSQIDSVKYLSRVRSHLARVALHRGEITKAEVYGEIALTHQTQIRSITDIAESLHWSGEAAYLKGDYRKAHAYHEQCLKMVTEVNMELRINRSLLSLGNLAVAEGDFQLAKEYFDQADFTINANQGYIGGPGWAALGSGEWAEARHYFQAGLRAMLEKGAKLVGLDALVGIAHLKLQDNEFRQALDLLALVKYHPASSWEVREKVRKLWENLVAELPSEQIAEADARGREMNLLETAETLLA